MKFRKGLFSKIAEGEKFFIIWTSDEISKRFIFKNRGRRWSNFPKQACFVGI